MQDLLQPNTINIILNTVTTILKLLIHAISNTMVKDSIESIFQSIYTMTWNLNLLLNEKWIIITGLSVRKVPRKKKLLILCITKLYSLRRHNIWRMISIPFVFQSVQVQGKILDNILPKPHLTTQWASISASFSCFHCAQTHGVRATTGNLSKRANETRS